MLRRAFIFTFSLIAFLATAQSSRPDTIPTIAQGVIRVKKPLPIKDLSPQSDYVAVDSLLHRPHPPREKPKDKKKIIPYVKVDYKLYLSNVKRVDIIRYVNNVPYRDKVPVFDSMRYPENLERVYPQQTVTLSKTFSSRLDQPVYFEKDSDMVDTMYVGLWIGEDGKIKWAEADTMLAGDMPKEVMSEIAFAATHIREWGYGGGFKTPKKFLKPSKFVPESYYCELFVIVSAHPLTSEQKTKSLHMALFDYPLNCPASDEKQREWILKQDADIPKKEK
jgi:hypothetical protein